MITFLISILSLFAGYFIYGKFVERVFVINENHKTPALAKADGVDYIPMSTWKIFLIQFLNIAGLGPIFGAIIGAVYGPTAFLWIVFGSIFGGAVHDYFSGMISLRNSGLSLPEITGKYLGNFFKQFTRVFSILLMVLVGAVFVAGPAKLLSNLTSDTLFLNITTSSIFASFNIENIDTFKFIIWGIIIFLYYILATLLPINKLIGRIYPLFGFTLLFMAIGIGFSLIYYQANIPEITFDSLRNMHPNPQRFPLFPMIFISIACGAISGFHATQSPLMVRCMTNENQGRKIFYGAMIAEALVTLIWAAAAMSFFGSISGLQLFLTENDHSAAVVVDRIAHTWLGSWGGFLVIIGVIVAPITTGDTAFRSARLIVADMIKCNQKSIYNRILVSIPLFIIGFFILQINFDIIWRYMAWSNQVLAVITLWMITVYLVKENKPYWITLLPAVFMTMVTSTYIIVAPEGLEYSILTGYIVGGIVTLVVSSIFIYSKKKIRSGFILMLHEFPRIFGTF